MSGPDSSLSNVLNSLAGGLVTATYGAHGALTDLINPASQLYGALYGFISNNDPNTNSKPKAYLNWILLDDQFKG